jgi:hypothetical protein
MPSETCDRIRVERYFLDEAVGEEKTATALHLESCPKCRERLASLTHERAAYLTAQPFSAFAARRLEKRSPSGRLLPMPRWLPALAGALACIAVVAVIKRPSGSGSVGPGPLAADESLPDDGIRTKGGLAFEFHYSRDGKVQAGDLGLEYRAGDVLQFVYSAGEYPYVSLASVDAGGTVSLYRHEGDLSKASLPAKPGKMESLPFSVTLDAAPVGELFVLVVSREPLESAKVEAWLDSAWNRASGELGRLERELAPPKPGGAEIKTLLVRKKAAA